MGCTPLPGSEPSRAAARLTAGDGPYGEQVLYLHFDGVSVTRIAAGNPDDAATNQSSVPDQRAVGTAHTTAAFDATPFGALYSAQAAKARIAQQVASWFADFNVQVVTARPASGRYTMILIGGPVGDVFGDSRSATGSAPLNCNKGCQIEIGDVFSSNVTPTTSATPPEVDAAITYVAIAAAHSAGSAFALENVNNSMDLMAGVLSVTANAFVDSASAYTAAPAPASRAAPPRTAARSCSRTSAPRPSGPSPPTSAPHRRWTSRAAPPISARREGAPAPPARPPSNVARAASA